MQNYIKDDFQSVLRTLESWKRMTSLLRNYLHEVSSKFQNNRHYGREAVETLCFIHSVVTWWNNFAAVKIKEFEKPQRQGMWFVTNNIDLHSIESEVTMFINIRVLRLRGTDWKSSLSKRKVCSGQRSELKAPFGSVNNICIVLFLFYSS